MGEHCYPLTLMSLPFRINISCGGIEYGVHLICCKLWLTFSRLVFPGGYIPSLAFLVETMKTGSQGRLTIDSVHNIGPHYSRTLREWKRKFLSNWDDVIAKALVDQYQLSEQELEIFKRKWICKLFYSLGVMLKLKPKIGSPQITCELGRRCLSYDH